MVSSNGNSIVSCLYFLPLPLLLFFSFSLPLSPSLSLPLSLSLSPPSLFPSLWFCFMPTPGTTIPSCTTGRYATRNTTVCLCSVFCPCPPMSFLCRSLYEHIFSVSSSRSLLSTFNNRLRMRNREDITAMQSSSQTLTPVAGPGE